MKWKTKFYYRLNDNELDGFQIIVKAYDIEEADKMMEQIISGNIITYDIKD